MPSRGRPDNVERLVHAWIDTGATAALVVVCDDDDPLLPDYADTWGRMRPEAPFMEVQVGPRVRLGPTLNREAVSLARSYRYLGFMGDDHLPVTVAWDEHIRDNLNNLNTGIAYGNDLHQGPNLPTAVFMTSDIVKALGYFCPPGLVHMYLDNAWKDWGTAMDRLRYLPQVIIEHLHPDAGKATHDERYEETNTMMEPDHLAFGQYQSSGEFAKDCATLNALINP